MKSLLLKDQYPVKVLELPKSEAKFQSVDEVLSDLKNKIENHPVAVYIATFDHFSHTKSIPEHKMAEDIKDVKNIIFCFGKELPKSAMASVRPRSIAVADEGEKFVISFMDAPNDAAQDSMISWVEDLKK